MGKELWLIFVNFRFWIQSMGILLQGEGRGETKIFALFFLDCIGEDFMYTYIGRIVELKVRKKCK